MAVLHGDLLQGRGVALAPGVPAGLAEALAAHGARLERLESVAEPAEEHVGDWARARQPLHALLYAASASFGAGGPEALARTLQEAWVAIREVAVGALIDSGQPSKVVLLGPASDAGTYTEATRSALENLARTLSVEWARYGITVVMVAPGPGTAEQDLAELICFLSSRAGEYFSGCRIEVGSSAG